MKNTESDFSNSNDAEIPDYTLAAREAATLLEANKISMVIVSAIAKVKKAESKDGHDWPHVEFTLAFFTDKSVGGSHYQEFTYSYY